MGIYSFSLKILNSIEKINIIVLSKLVNSFKLVDINSLFEININNYNKFKKLLIIKN